MSDPETIAAYDRQVEAYADLTRRHEPDPALLAFAAGVPPGGTVLDLGCGPGNAAAELRDRGFRVDAVDASLEMVQLANKLHDIGARQATFDDIDALATYDGVWANFSLLHARRQAFPRHLAAIRRALKTDGLLHIGMKLGSGEARDRLGRFYTYYSETELAGHLAVGFAILETASGRERGLAGDIEPWITILARANAGP